MTDDIKQLTDEVSAIKARLTAMEQAQRENTAATLEGARDAREMLEIFQAVKGGFKVLGWLAAVVKWAGIIGGGVAAIYAAWHAVSGGAKP